MGTGVSGGAAMCNMPAMPWRARRHRWFWGTTLASVLCCATVMGVTWIVVRDRAPAAAKAAPAPPPPASESPDVPSFDPDPEWVPEKPSDRWKLIVIHHSASEAGGADRFAEWHRTKGWKDLGYHFVIGNGTDSDEGEVEVGDRWTAQARGAHTLSKGYYHNQHGIGICLVGNFDARAPGEDQMESLNRLVGYLCREFKIPPKQILTHRQVTGQTNCPGKLFDVEAVRTAAREAVAATQPANGTGK